MNRFVTRIWRHPLFLLAAGVLTTIAAVAGVAFLVDRDLQQQSRLINVSARGTVGPGPESLLVGFVVAEGSQKLVVRGLGPSLAREGGPAVLSRVLLRVISHDTGEDAGRNEQWRSPGNERLWGDLKHLAPPHQQDAACVLTLPPGGYSALVEAREGQRGLASIEIFVVKW